MTGTFDMDAPITQHAGAETREGGHVMMMHFNIGLPLGEMLFKNWVVEDETDLAWVSLKLFFTLHHHIKKCTLKSENEYLLLRLVLHWALFALSTRD